MQGRCLTERKWKRRSVPIWGMAQRGTGQASFQQPGTPSQQRLQSFLTGAQAHPRVTGKKGALPRERWSPQHTRDSYGR